jgi:probable HAF family extracellular repeat protein
MLNTSSRRSALHHPGRSVVLAMSVMAATAVNAQVYDFRLLPPTSQDANIGRAINDRGDVVGSGGQRPVSPTLWQGGTTYFLETPPIPTYYGGTANALNNTGAIVGQSSAARALVWQDRQVSELPTPANARSAAFGVNDRGLAVGWTTRFGADGSVVGTHATLWSAGTNYQLPSLGGLESHALAINDQGQIAGWSYTGAGFERHATLWQAGQLIDLGAAGGRESWANAINDRGVVAGAASLGEDYARAAVWIDGQATVLDKLGPDWRTTIAYGINDAGVVVGTSLETGTGELHATLWNGTRATNLNSFLSAADAESGWRVAQALGINERGWITGVAYNMLTYEASAYIMAPVPEPASLALFTAGLAVLGWRLRRRPITAETEI